MRQNALWLAAAAVLAAAPARAQIAKDWTALSGRESGIARFQKVRVTDAAAWKALWAEHAKGSPEEPNPPAVAFDKGESVVGVFLGLKPTSGYSVVLESQETAPGELLVSFRVLAPNPGMVHLPALETPFRLQRVTKAYPTVRLEAADAAPRPAGRASARPISSGVAPSVRLASVKLESLKDALGSMTGGSDLAAPKFIEASLTGAAQLTAPLNQLPPPPGADPRQDGGKPLPPPPGRQQGGKPLPPPPGEEPGKPLPPPPGQDLPQPIYPGGPLPSRDQRLRDSQRTFDHSGMRYLGYWEGDPYYETAKGVVNTAPNDRGSAYILNLESKKYQAYKRFYYNPADSGYYWMPDSELMKTRTKRIVVDFADRAGHPLLPWERESFEFSFNGERQANDGVRLESSAGAYRYDVRYSYDPSDPLTLTVQMEPREKLPTSPDRDGVSAQIAPDGRGGLKLLVSDKWGGYYAGESLDLQLVVKLDSGHWYKPNRTVYSADGSSPLRITVPAAASQGQALTLEAPIPAGAGSGTFILDSWSFRRGNSRISSADWIYKGGGNKITK